MILSFHPIIEGDRNIICAGRDPDKEDLAAIRSARAVILPQGCRESLYRVAAQNCPFVFPDYESRFNYPGKLNQTRLFRKMGVPVPKSMLFEDLNRFSQTIPTLKPGYLPEFPFVFKFDWGGEGEFVYLVESVEKLTSLLDLAAVYERSGQQGFLIQELIPGKPRSLRVVVIHRKIISYWRENSEGSFYANTARGGFIDPESDPEGRKAGEQMVAEFCRKTRINLAGFDLMGDGKAFDKPLLFLEINYFFGRKGLGGSENYYRVLAGEIRNWVSGLPDSESGNTIQSKP
jgi:ribosomal protein S6--L-glutamate ligase